MIPAVLSSTVTEGQRWWVHRPGQCSFCQCAVLGIGLPGSHTVESSTIAIAGIGAQQATSGYSLGGSLSWSSPAEGWEWGQAEVSSLLKGLPAGRMTLLGGWKVPGTPRPPSFWIPWYSSVLNHSRDRHAGTTHMIRACWGGETALARWCFLYLLQNQPKEEFVWVHEGMVPCGGDGGTVGT